MGLSPLRFYKLNIHHCQTLFVDSRNQQATSSILCNNSKLNTRTKLFNNNTLHIKLGSHNDIVDIDFISKSIFFEFSKIFDGVSHLSLPYKLGTYKIHETILERIASISPTNSQVKIGTYFMPSSIPVISFPQCFILSPLTIFLYINHFLDNLSRGSLL